MKEDHLSDAEKKLFKGLSSSIIPPKDLEKRVIAQLINDGQINKSPTMNTYIKWVAAIAASVLLFLGGMYFGKSNSINIEPTLGYMLLLHENQEFQPGDAMEMFEEYSAWMNNTFKRGVKITGQELQNDAAIISNKFPVKYLDGSQDSRTTGYFILEAQSLEDALAVAQENPHVKYGGTVEVKSFLVR